MESGPFKIVYNSDLIIRDRSEAASLSNLPDTHKSRWGDELTAEKMKKCAWLRPELRSSTSKVGRKRASAVFDEPK